MNYTEQDIPKYFSYYIDKCYEVSPQLFHGDYNVIKNNIIQRLLEASKIVSIEPAELLRRLDIKKNSYESQSFEAFLAELRTIFWLEDLGFDKIEPIKQSKKVASPDFRAEYKGNSVIVEVFCMTYTFQQKKDEKYNCYIDSDKRFKDLFRRNVLEKLKGSQLGYEADIKIILGVINSKPAINLNRQSDFDNYLNEIYIELKLRTEIHLGILTGKEDLKEGLDDTIYPKL